MQALRKTREVFTTKRELAEAVSAAEHLSRKKVGSVAEIDPAAVDAERYIYLVPKDGQEGDLYDEYMVLDGKPERVGSWAAPLSGYVEKEEGKGLSSNDFTNDYKDKLDGLTFATDEEIASMLEEVLGDG